MEKRKGSMKSVSVWAIAAVLIIAACLLMAGSPAQAETVKFRIVGYHDKLEILPVGDEKSHVLVVGEARGLYFAGSEVAAYTEYLTVDHIKGKGLVQGYQMVTYEDGSTTVNTFQFTLIRSPDGKTALIEDGKGEYIKGTGRFEGIKGTTSFSGKRYTPNSPGLKETKGEFVKDGTATYTLPPKK